MTGLCRLQKSKKVAPAGATFLKFGIARRPGLLRDGDLGGEYEPLVA
jgi:hypothetical protein